MPIPWASLTAPRDAASSHAAISVPPIALVEPTSEFKELTNDWLDVSVLPVSADSALAMLCWVVSDEVVLSCREVVPLVPEVVVSDPPTVD